MSDDNGIMTVMVYDGDDEIAGFFMLDAENLGHVLNTLAVNMDKMAKVPLSEGIRVLGGVREVA